jgi:hypothetical protein
MMAGAGGGGGGTVHNYGKVTLYNKEYRTIEINGIIWLADNFIEELPGISINPSGTPSTPALWRYNGTILYNGYAAEIIGNNLNTNYSEWRVSNSSDWNNLISFSGGSNVAGLVNKTRDYGGIDANGLSIEILGYRSVTGSFDPGEADFRLKDNQGVFFYTSNNVDTPQDWNPIGGGTIRLCKDA